MSEVTKIEELPNGEGWLEFYSDGRIRAKDMDGKMIKHPRNYMPKKAASAMGYKAAAKKGQDTGGEISDLLEYLGLDSPFDFQLAKLLIDGKSGAIAASKELIKAAQTRGSFKGEAPVDNCPFQNDCGIFKYKDSEIPKAEVDAASDRIEEDREDIPDI